MTQRRFFAALSLFTLCLMALLPIGCGGGGGNNDNNQNNNPSNPTDRTGRDVPQPDWNLNNNQQSTVQPRKKWTILVYMNGANDLEEYGLQNMNQMELTGSDPANINIVTQFKRNAGRFDNRDGDWGDTRRYYVTSDGDRLAIRSQMLSSRNNLDMGSAQTLREFVDWGVETFPADRYAIFLWNHGAGWRSQKDTGTPTRGFSYDDKTNNHIDTIELAAALDIRGKINRKWDLIVWDSSLMQMAEVAHELRDTTDYIVGSCESPPGNGYPYDLFLNRLATDPAMDARMFGTFIVEDTFFAYNDNTYINGWSAYNMHAESAITQSLLDASKINELTGAVDQLGGALLGARTQYGAAIATAREDTEGSREGSAYFMNRDLQHFCSLLAPTVPDGNVQTAIQRVRAASQATILRSVNGPGHPQTRGLYIFLPSPSVYNDIDIRQANGFGQRYQLLSFPQAAPNWQAFLTQGPP